MGSEFSQYSKCRTVGVASGFVKNQTIAVQVQDHTTAVTLYRVGEQCARQVINTNRNNVGIGTVSHTQINGLQLSVSIQSVRRTHQTAVQQFVGLRDTQYVDTLINFNCGSLNGDTTTDFYRPNRNFTSRSKLIAVIVSTTTGTQYRNSTSHFVLQYVSVSVCTNNVYTTVVGQSAGYGTFKVIIDVEQFNGDDQTNFSSVNHDSREEGLTELVLTASQQVIDDGVHLSVTVFTLVISFQGDRTLVETVYYRSRDNRGFGVRVTQFGSQDLARTSSHYASNSRCGYVVGFNCNVQILGNRHNSRFHALSSVDNQLTVLAVQAFGGDSQGTQFSVRHGTRSSDLGELFSQITNRVNSYVFATSQ